MSINAFAQGFGQGVGTGIQLGEAVLSGRSARGLAEANEILAEMEGIIPPAFQPAGAVPEDGEQPAQGTANGYDGNEWDAYKQRYARAMKNVTDVQTLAAMERRLADLEKGKVMENGRMALAAIQAGDMEKAQRYMANISYYVDPGVTPNVQVDGGGNVFVETPEGGMALTPDNLADFLHQLENFEGWQQLTFDRQRHADTMDHNAKVLAADILSQERRDAAYIRGVDSEIARRDIQNQATMLDIEATQAEMEQARETHLAGLDSAAREQFQSDVTDMQETFDSFYDDPGRLADIGGGSEDGEDALLMGTEPAIPTDSEIAVDALSQSARESQAFLQQNAADLRLELETTPLMREFAQAMMEGLRAGDPEGDFSNEMLARLAFLATHDTQGYADYDPESGTLRVGTPGSFTYYDIGLRHRPLLNALWGAQNPEQGAPMPPEQGPAMPQQTAVPEPAGAPG